MAPRMTRKQGEDTVKRAGNRGLGRPKGSKNKMTVAAKEAINIAAERLGGAERLAEWAQESEENERAFWVQVYPKLLPHQIEGTGEAGEIIFKTVYEAAK